MSYKYYHHYLLSSDIVEEVIRAAKLEHVNPSRLVESILEIGLEAYFDERSDVPHCCMCGDSHYLTDTLSPENREEWYCRACIKK